MVTVRVKLSRPSGGRFFQFSTPIATRKAYNIFAREKDRLMLKKVKKQLLISASLLKKAIARNAPKKTGDLRKLIKSIPITNIKSAGGRVSILFKPSGSLILEIKLGSKKHQKILWVNNGTGIFGPEKRPILPINASVLRFKVGRRIIFAKSVRGQRGQRFIERSIKEEAPKITKRMVKVLK